VIYVCWFSVDVGCESGTYICIQQHPLPFPQYICQTVTDYRYSPEEACKAMLLKWHTSNREPTYEKLNEAVKSYKANSGNYQIDKVMYVTAALVL